MKLQKQKEIFNRDKDNSKNRKKAIYLRKCKDKYSRKKLI